MSSAQHLREFISQRLTAAAEEIFSEFEKTIVQYKEEIDRQRRLLDITWKPRIKLHRIDPQQRDDKEDDVLTLQQLCNQERSSSLDQGVQTGPVEPELPQIKGGQQELFTSQENEQLVLKDETDTCMVTVNFDQSELELNRKQLLSPNSAVTESLHQGRIKHEEPELNTNEEPEPEDKLHRNRTDLNRSRSNTVDNSPVSESHCNADAGKKSVKCDVCGKAFKYQYLLNTHRRIHTGEKPYSCLMCGKTFMRSNGLLVHIRVHTGQKPFSCKICGKSFTQCSGLTCHMRSHAGEKPYSCNTCGKRFTASGQLTTHVRTHTGEKPYSCNTCGKRFTTSGQLTVHTRTHTGERPYPCKMCGKRFKRSDDLLSHMRIHTGERPYPCKICGKSFAQSGNLTLHMRRHGDEKPDNT